VDEVVQEFELQTRLSDHANVASVFEIFRTQENGQGLISIVMEYCESDLEKYLQRPEALLAFYALSASEIAVSWIPQLLLALASIHKHLILHRDIKPGASLS
jgi:serine/threonine protein kinase